MADQKNPQQGGTQGGQQQGTDRTQPTYREQRQQQANTPRPGETQEQADERVRREQQSGGGDNT
jgi:hypothetical protein